MSSILTNNIAFTKHKNKSRQVNMSDKNEKQCEIISDVEEPDDDDGGRLHDGSVQLHKNDLACLDDGKYLNDNIIHFYLNTLLTKQVPYEISSRVELFDSIFFSLLLKTFNDKRSIEVENLKKLRQWYIDVDIFRKDYLIFPICQAKHWFVVIVCNPRNVKRVDIDESSQAKVKKRRREHKAGMLILDSLTKHKTTAASLTIRDFLDFDWRMSRPNIIKKFSHHDFPDYRPKVPPQQNNYDCGLYMLMYCKHFLKNPDEIYSRMTDSDNREYMKQLSKDIKQSLTDNSRESIRNFILEQCRQSEDTQ